MNKLGRYRLIKDRASQEEYMHRYYLFLKDRKTFPFNLLLHTIVRSDDPYYHDHPWDYTTIILKGGYWEHTPIFDDKSGKIIGDNRKWRGPGSIISRKSTDFHWLEMGPAPAVTLFIPKKRCREWGFVDSDTGSWMHHTVFLRQKYAKAAA